MLIFSTLILQNFLITSTAAYYWTNLKKRINGKVGVWTHNFLPNRHQCVAVKGTTSSAAQVRSGVPGRWVLGPLIFLIHISDINNEITGSTASCFDYDTRILRGINDEENTHADATKWFTYSCANGLAELLQTKI